MRAALTRGLWLAVILCGTATAQDPNLILSVDMASGSVGSEEQVAIVLDSSASSSFSGWSLALCHNPSQLSIVEVALGSTVVGLPGLTGGEPAFNQTTLYPDGFTSAVILNFLGTITLPPAADNELNIITYSLETVGLAPLTLCDDVLGTPPVSISFGSTSILPTLVHGSIEVGTVPNYILRAGTTSGAQGSMVEVPVSLDNLIAITGFSISMTYDENVATLQEIAVGSALECLNEGEGPDYFF
ncbi:MAG: hypothetical protein KDC38_18940 [Planctomycetes bacterium]|nr:hypothetical protein [Planctomycetota bacterium]